MPKASSS